MPRFDSASDRRQFPRTKLVEIAYIGMGPENGGLVLDVSDGGLSFHSVAPVQRAETVRFLLSLRGHSRIEGAGEVVWTNEMKTVCGLKFTALSSGAREYLNNWTNLSRPPEAAREAPVLSSPQVPPPAEAVDRVEVVEEVEPAAQFAAAVEERQLAIASGAFQDSAAPVETASEPEPGFEPEFASSYDRELYLSAPLESTSLWQSPVLSWLTVGLLIVSLTAAAYIYGVRVGQSQISPVTRASVNPVSQGDTTSLGTASAAPSPATSDAPPVAPEAAAIANAAAATMPSGASTVSSTAAVSTTALASSARTDDAASPSPRPLAANRVPSAADLLAQQEAGKAQLATAISYLNGDNGRRDIPKAVQLLWAAVRNGNSDAEVTLSDLYVMGDGVEKNCEQARVLLRAATKSGNPAGMVKLGELETDGCP